MRKSSISHLSNIELKELSISGLNGVDAVKKQVADLQGQASFNDTYALPSGQSVNALKASTDALVLADQAHDSRFVKLDNVVDKFFNASSKSELASAVASYNADHGGADVALPSSPYQTLPELNQKLSDLGALVSNGGSVLDPGVQMLNSANVYSIISARNDLAADITISDADANFVLVTILNANGYTHFANLFGYTGSGYLRTRYIVDPYSPKSIRVVLPGNITIDAYKGWILELSHYSAPGTGPSNFVISPVANNMMALIDSNYTGVQGATPVQTVWLCVRGGGVSGSAAWVRVSNASSGSASGLRNLYDLPDSQGAGTMVSSASGIYPTNAAIQSGNSRSILYNADIQANSAKNASNTFAFSTLYNVEGYSTSPGQFLFGYDNTMYLSPLSSHFGSKTKSNYARGSMLVGDNVVVGGYNDVISFSAGFFNTYNTTSSLIVTAGPVANRYTAAYSSVISSYDSAVMTPSSLILGGAKNRIASVRVTNAVNANTDELSHNSAIISSSRSFIVGGVDDPILASAKLGRTNGSSAGGREAWYDRMFSSSLEPSAWSSVTDFYNTTDPTLIALMQSGLGSIGMYEKYHTTHALVRCGFDVYNKVIDDTTSGPGATVMYRYANALNAGIAYQRANNTWFGDLMQKTFAAYNTGTPFNSSAANKEASINAAMDVIKSVYGSGRGFYPGEYAHPIRGFMAKRYRAGQAGWFDSTGVESGLLRHSFTNNSGSVISGGADHIIMGGSIGASVIGGEFNLLNNSSFSSITASIRSAIVGSVNSVIHGTYNIIANRMFEDAGQTGSVDQIKNLENAYNMIAGGLNNTIIGDASYNHVFGKHNTIHNYFKYSSDLSGLTRMDYNMVHGYANTIVNSSHTYVFGTANYIGSNRGPYAVIGHSPAIGLNNNNNMYEQSPNTIRGMSIESGGDAGSGLRGDFYAFMFGSSRLDIVDTEINTYAILGSHNVRKDTASSYYSMRLARATAVISSSGVVIKNNSGVVLSSDNVYLGKLRNTNGVDAGLGHSTVIQSYNVEAYGSIVIGSSSSINAGRTVDNALVIGGSNISRTTDIPFQDGRLNMFACHDIDVGTVLRNTVLEWNSSSVHGKISMMGVGGLTYLGGRAAIGLGTNPPNPSLTINPYDISGITACVNNILADGGLKFHRGFTSANQTATKSQINQKMNGRVVIDIDDIILYDRNTDRYLAFDYVAPQTNGRFPVQLVQIHAV